MQENKANIIVDLSFQFSLKIIEFVEILEAKNKFIIAKQLLNSGTSIGANIYEAQNAESKADFIHKMKIAAKEADETKYWLLLCKHSKSYPIDENLLIDLETITKILSKIIGTTKRNINV